MHVFGQAMIRPVSNQKGGKEKPQLAIYYYILSHLKNFHLQHLRFSNKKTQHCYCLLLFKGINSLGTHFQLTGLFFLYILLHSLSRTNHIVSLSMLNNTKS